MTISRATLDAMRQLARDVKAGRPRSHVQAADILSDFVLENFPEDARVCGACGLDPTGPREPVDDVNYVPAK